MRRSAPLLSSFHVFFLLREFCQLAPVVWILYRSLGACSLSRMLCSKLLVGFVMQCFLWNHMFQLLPLRISPLTLKFHPRHSGQGTILLLLVTTHLLATLTVWNILGIPPKRYELLPAILHDLDCNVLFRSCSPFLWLWETRTCSVFW